MITADLSVAHPLQGECELPRGAEILSVGCHRGSRLTVHALADSLGPLVRRRFLVLRDGAEINEPIPANFRLIGRVDAQELHGQRWHVWETPEGFHGAV